MESKKVSLAINEKPKKRRLRVGDPDFTPPDGGWGWLIVFACGFSNLSTFPMFQQFGLVFREKFDYLGISETQTTTVINMNSAFNACVGLLNGPAFRKFTYRQVAIFGSLLVSVSLFACSFCESFWTFMIFYSMCYGSGIGITQSSNALALNTYFKGKRRIATGLSWTTTGMGPVVWPYIIVFFNNMYGMEGTLMLFSAFALHAFMCSLLLHPVEWHTQFKIVGLESGGIAEINGKNNIPQLRKKSTSIFSSQYLLNEDDPFTPGYEITDPGTPMMVKSNDGWYSQSKSQVGSRLSLASNKSKKLASGQNSVALSQRPSYVNLAEHGRERTSSQTKRTMSQKKITITEEVEPEETHLLELPNEKEVLKVAAKKLAEYQIKEKETDAEPNVEKLSIWKKISIFFDFELFKDYVYVNLMLGITVANFAELNFSILTPIVLEEFKFEKFQIATFMSLLGATDIAVRFFIPFIADKIGWDNRSFFLFGVMSMAIGRIILVHTQTYPWGLLVAVIIGAGKGLRTIFMALVIPSHVPLERLPAASGLQLATSGILFIILGPLVGWIREIVQNYVITLHLLNICTYSTAVAWTIERILTNRKKRLQRTEPGTPNSFRKATA